MYFVPRLWLVSTGASRLPPKAVLRVVARGVEVTLFLAWARRLFDWGRWGLRLGAALHLNAELVIPFTGGMYEVQRPGTEHPSPTPESGHFEGIFPYTDPYKT